MKNSSEFELLRIYQLRDLLPILYYIDFLNQSGFKPRFGTELGLITILHIVVSNSHQMLVLVTILNMCTILWAPQCLRDSETGPLFKKFEDPFYSDQLWQAMPALLPRKQIFCGSHLGCRG